MSNALPAVASDAATVGWTASLNLVFEPRPTKTVLAQRVQRGPLAVQRPFYPENEVCHVYLLHPPGGVVGGDELTITTQVKQGTHSVVTTPGATKFYRSQGQIARQRQQLSIANGATLEWLPQETIYFPGAKAKLTTRIDIEATARFIGWETHCFGLPANQEPFSDGELQIKLEVFRQNEPFILEKMTVNAESLQRPTGLRGSAVMSTLIAVPADEQVLQQVRDILVESEQLFSATLLDDCLVVRYIGDSTEQSRRMFIQVWNGIRPLVLERPACAPRIWST